MGRRSDQFAWDQVEGSKLSWTCKYCGESYSGAASRINNHLSGEANDITACSAVPENIRNQAKKKTTGKKVRKDSPIQDPSASTSNAIQLTTEKAIKEYLTQAIMKMLMIVRTSSTPTNLDKLNDPCIKECLDVIQECYNIQLSPIWDNPSISRTAKFHIGNEVNDNVGKELKESWKTMGYTLMVFSGNVLSTLKRSRCVVALYCPKGIFFLEAPHPDTDFDAFKEALGEHTPSLEFNRANTNVILRHNSNCFSPRCEIEYLQCFRYEIQDICVDTCRESDWAGSLIEKAVKYHELMCLLWPDVKKDFEEDEENEGELDGYKSLALVKISIFHSFMRLEPSLKKKLDNLLTIYLNNVELYGTESVPVEIAIYNDSVFWEDGLKLHKLLTDIFRVPDLMDTLVPTIGYLEMAIAQVEDNLNSRSNREHGGQDFEFWDLLKTKLTSSTQGNSREAAKYLNPVFYLKQQEDPHLQENLKKALIKYIFANSEKAQELLHEGREDDRDHVDKVGDWRKFIADVQGYDNVFRNLNLDKGLEHYHPLILWEKHGRDLPVLRKCALRILSQPVNCMCNQVKKHMVNIKGSRDYILRLNLNMMHEFKLLGDEFTNPLHRS